MRFQEIDVYHEKYEKRDVKLDQLSWFWLTLLSVLMFCVWNSWNYYRKREANTRSLCKQVSSFLFLSLSVALSVYVCLENHLCEILRLVVADCGCCEQLVASISLTIRKMYLWSEQRNERLNKKYVIAIKYKRSHFLFVLVSSTFFFI